MGRKISGEVSVVVRWKFVVFRCAEILNVGPGFLCFFGNTVSPVVAVPAGMQRKQIGCFAHMSFTSKSRWSQSESY